MESLNLIKLEDRACAFSMKLPIPRQEINGINKEKREPNEFNDLANLQYKVSLADCRKQFGCQIPVSVNFFPFFLTNRNCKHYDTIVM